MDSTWPTTPLDAHKSVEMESSSNSSVMMATSMMLTDVPQFAQFKLIMFVQIILIQLPAFAATMAHSKLHLKQDKNPQTATP